MSFSPILPVSGLTGWRFLSRTMETQQDIHRQSSQVSREIQHFKDNIAELTTPEALVNDRTALKVALGAFGLQDDINNRAYIEKVLSEGTLERSSFANRLADKRYQALSAAFGYDYPAGPRMLQSGFATQITEAFLKQDFEISVGQVDQSMRLALTLQRELPEIAAAGGSETTQWYRVLGNPPVRQIFETALGLPSGFSGLDLDRQVNDMRDILTRRLGTDDLSEIAGPSGLDTLTRLFFARSGASAPTISAPVVGLFSGGASANSLLLTLAQRY